MYLFKNAEKEENELLVKVRECESDRGTAVWSRCTASFSSSSIRDPKLWAKRRVQREKKRTFSPIEKRRVGTRRRKKIQFSPKLNGRTVVFVPSFLRSNRVWSERLLLWGSSEFSRVRYANRPRTEKCEIINERKERGKEEREKPNNTNSFFFCRSNRRDFPGRAKSATSSAPIPAATRTITTETWPP